VTDLEGGVRADIGRRSPELERMKPLGAVVDASRGAFVVAVPRLKGELDRAEGARAALPQLKDAGGLPRWREVVLVVAFLVGVVAVSFILPSPRNGRVAIDVDAGALWVGVLAVVSLVGLVSQERTRPRSKYFGSRTRNGFRMYLFLAVLWAVALAFIVINWDEVDDYEPWGPIAGVCLLAAAILGAIALAVYARRADRDALGSPEFIHATEPVVDPVEQWWAGVALKLSPAERGSADKSYDVVLTVLEEKRIIRPQDARRLRRKKPPVVWAGDAS